MNIYEKNDFEIRYFTSMHIYIIAQKNDYDFLTFYRDFLTFLCKTLTSDL